MDMLSEWYGACRQRSLSDSWERAAAATPDPDAFPETLAAMAASEDVPAYLPELARLERAVHSVKERTVEIPSEVERLTVNPTLELCSLSWRLSSLLDFGGFSGKTPEPGTEHVLIWRPPGRSETRSRAATPAELLALKIVVEEIDPETAAAENGVPVGVIDEALHSAVASGILLSPRSSIRRDSERFLAVEDIPEEMVSATVFSIQWHITQSCDLHCKHCYDRSSRRPLGLDQVLRVITDLRAFCWSRHVKGHVCFTGGNPFLHPHFFDLYLAAAQHGFALSVLGNPVPGAWLERLISIRMPRFYQVSLEGLKEHNDSIRGSGHFDRVIAFLRLLREFGISSTVMLTLTRDNIREVIPLAEYLRDLTDSFTFNRLSQVGEGASLFLPANDEYERFLFAYIKAAQSNPIIDFKDNLISIALKQRGKGPFDGCTGFGCGAAFNFMAVLADGEAHACRKFPSPIGNVRSQTIAEIYDSVEARRYRRGSAECRSCSIHPYCGGCLAISRSHGLDVFEQKDPQCFMNGQLTGGRSVAV